MVQNGRDAHHPGHHISHLSKSEIVSSRKPNSKNEPLTFGVWSVKQKMTTDHHELKHHQPTSTMFKLDKTWLNRKKIQWSYFDSDYSHFNLC